MNRPEGYKHIAFFLADVEDGLVPKTAAVEWLVAALTKVFDSSPESAPTHLELKWGRGKKPGRSALAYYEKWSPILTFVDETIAADPKPRGATGRALVAASEKYGKEKSVIEKAWRGLWKSGNDAMKQVAAEIFFVEAHTSENERLEMASKPFTDLMRLAQSRAGKTTAIK